MTQPAPASRTRWIPLAQGLAVSYLLAVGFLAAFVMTVAKGDLYAKGLSEPRWALLVAVVLVLPIVAPWVARTIAPRLKVLKIADLAEFEFSDTMETRSSLDALVSHLSMVSGETNASEYAGMMTSLSAEISATVDRLELTGEEVLVVDLRAGRAWVLPNLYFLALLVRRRTAVRQIAFVETRHVDGAFVCMCTPDELLDASERAYPELRRAAGPLTYDLIMTRGFSNAGLTFFNGLRAQYQQANAGGQVKDLWLTSTALFQLLGARAHRDSVAWHEPLSEAEHLAVLRSAYPYTAALDDGELLFLISRDRVALVIAREVTRRHLA